jgi:hypothetical protein
MSERKKNSISKVMNTKNYEYQCVRAIPYCLHYIIIEYGIAWTHRYLLLQKKWESIESFIKIVTILNVIY